MASVVKHLVGFVGGCWVCPICYSSSQLSVPWWHWPTSCCRRTLANHESDPTWTRAVV
jgi:hypothetical protein